MPMRRFTSSFCSLSLISNLDNVAVPGMGVIMQLSMWIVAILPAPLGPNNPNVPS